MDSTQSAKDQKFLKALKNQDRGALWLHMVKIRPQAERLAANLGLQDPQNVADEALVSVWGAIPKLNYLEDILDPDKDNYLFTMVINRIKKQAETRKEHELFPGEDIRFDLTYGEDISLDKEGDEGNEDLDLGESRGKGGQGYKGLGWRGYRRDDAARAGEVWVEEDRLSKEYPKPPFYKFLMGCNPRDESLDRWFREVIAQVNSIEGETAKQRMVKYLQGYSLSDIAKEEPPNPQTGKAISKQAVYNSIKEYLAKWGWNEERVKKIRYSWLVAALIDIERNVSPRPPQSKHSYTSPSTISTEDLKDPSFVNQLHHYYSQFHQQLITDPRTKAWNFPESSIEAISNQIGISF